MSKSYKKEFKEKKKKRSQEKEIDLSTLKSNIAIDGSLVDSWLTDINNDIEEKEKRKNKNI